MCHVPTFAVFVTRCWSSTYPPHSRLRRRRRHRTAMCRRSTGTPASDGPIATHRHTQTHRDVRHDLPTTLHPTRSRYGGARDSSNVAARCYYSAAEPTAQRARAVRHTRQRMCKSEICVALLIVTYIRDVVTDSLMISLTVTNTNIQYAETQTVIQVSNAKTSTRDTSHLLAASPPSGSTVRRAWPRGSILYRVDS